MPIQNKKSSVHIIYGSTSGNTQMVSETVAMLLEQQKKSVSLTRAEMATEKDLKKADLTILASSTYGHGLLQEYMQAFVDKNEAVDLKKHAFAVIGLGDPKYDAQYHIEAAPILEEWIQKHNGIVVTPALRISGAPVRHLKTLVPLWVKQLLTAM
ncbi:flavodoxin family protein [Candidatus Peregrinibacteria bacterium]|nr:MAG: flavodoxin family protein [Candidatus Peregrinibacteria bacterium]